MINLEKLRKEAGLTHKELAKKAGLTLATLQHCEDAFYVPGKKTLKKLASALNCTYKDLAGCEENNRIKELRGNAKLTQIQLSERAGVGRWIIQSIEIGNVSSITYDNAEKICRALKCNLEDLEIYIIPKQVVKVVDKSVEAGDAISTTDVEEARNERGAIILKDAPKMYGYI